MKELKSFLFRSFILTICMGCFLSSCRDEKVITGPEIDPEDIPQSIDSEITSFYMKSAYVGNVSGKMTEVLDICIPKRGSLSDPSLGLVVLGSINEIDCSLLEYAFLNGATIAVENPSGSDFQTFLSNHPEWKNVTSGTQLDGLLLYSFDKDGSDYFLERYVPINFDSLPLQNTLEDEEDVTENQTGTDSYNFIPKQDYVPEYYTNIRTWIDYLNDNDLDSNEKDPDHKEVSTVDFAASQQITGVETFDLDPRFRKYGSGLYWELNNAKVKMSYRLDIIPIHVYEKSSDHVGNYFLVDAYITLDSKDAWKFNSKNNKPLSQCVKGTWCHYAGAYSKYAAITFELVDEKGKPLDNITFSGDVIPHNDNKEVSYTNTSSCEVGTSLSVGAKQKGTTLAVGADASVSAGWKWEKTVQYTQKDVVVAQHDVNQTTGKAGWSFNFLNTPDFDKGKKGWIDMGSNLNCRGAETLHCCWIWKDANAKDDNNKTYRVKVGMEGYNEVGSYKSTGADWQTNKMNFIRNDTVDGKIVRIVNTMSEGPYVRVSRDSITVESRFAGGVALKHDFNEGYIRNIKLWKADDPNNPLYESSASHSPGENINLGYYFLKWINKPNDNKTSEELKLTFDYRRPGEKNVKYQYENNGSNTFRINTEGLTSKNNYMLLLKAGGDFEEVTN